ncbi:MAG: TraR/DksA C4-type zinc finger protein [Pseudorhodobacter sp.]|nr:TraR/DksA C4-type zinc finger protein [Frankiaceae bacterium]
MAPKAAPAKKAVPVTKAAPVKRAAVATKAAPAKKAVPVTKAAPARTVAKATSVRAATSPRAGRSTVGSVKKAATASDPAPLTGGDAWSVGELAGVRAELEVQATALRGEIVDAEAQDAALKRDSGGEGTGDEADAGSKTFEREHEMSLANNSRDLLMQVERALSRLDGATYGRCENCGKPIPKARLQALPAATMCMACKRREERR